MTRKEIERKKRKAAQPFVMPMGYGERVPEGLSPLAEFIHSCEGEISHEEALKEYQEEWCEHPRKMRRLISTIAQPFAGLWSYEVACDECGQLKRLKGRPPSWLNRHR